MKTPMQELLEWIRTTLPMDLETPQMIEQKIESMLEKLETLKTNNKMKKTIAQQLNIKEFPFEIKDKNGNVIYWENSNGDWYRREYDSYGNETHYENSKGFIENRGPKDGVAEINTTKGMEHKNPLTNPSEHTLQELFAELKFGRPSASQEYLDKCITELNEQEAMKRTLIIYNTKETTQEEAAHLLDILNCDDSMIWDNADRCGVEIIEVPTDKAEE